MEDNIFSYQGDRGDLVEIFYRLLMTGEVVSYEDILKEYDGGELSVVSPTKHALYGVLKKVVPEMVNLLKVKGFPIEPAKTGRNTGYQYIGSYKDPLGNMKFKALLEERREVIDNAIKEERPLRFTYWPFNKGKMDLVFHPHLLKTYNGRMFSIGVSEKEGKAPMRKYVVALDRIFGDIRGGRSTDTYTPPMADEYRYLSQLVGVTLEEGAELTTITLRAHDKYTFGRLKTKPMHDTQRVVCWPSFEEGREYGDVELTVYPNKELVGQILSYGSMLEVVGPDGFRQRVAEELNKMSERYGIVLCSENQ